MFIKLPFEVIFFYFYFGMKVIRIKAEFIKEVEMEFHNIW